jgi:MFS family permease
MNTFIFIVLGQIVSLFGNAALRFALPLYLLRQTGSAALYGGITALAMLPALAGMLTGGALADRCRKARLMALLDLVTAGIAAAAAAGLPHLPLLPLVLTVLGSLYAIQGLYQPVVRACLPLLLNGTQLLRGNAVIQLVDTVDELLGPLLGAVLLEHLGIRGLLVLCGCCFALSAGMELCLRIPQDVPRDTKLSVRSLWTDLRESAQFLTGQAAVLRLAAAMAAVNLLEVPALTVGVPVLVVQTLQKSDASLGLVQAVLSEIPVTRLRPSVLEKILATSSGISTSATSRHLEQTRWAWGSVLRSARNFPSISTLEISPRSARSVKLR